MSFGLRKQFLYESFPHHRRIIIFWSLLRYFFGIDDQ